MRTAYLLMAIAILVFGITTPTWAQNSDDQIVPGSQVQETASQEASGTTATAEANSNVTVTTTPPVVTVTTPRPHVTVNETPDDIDVNIQQPAIEVEIQPQNIGITVPDRDRDRDWFPWFITGIILTIFLLAFLAYLLAAFARGRYEESRRIEDRQRTDQQYVASEDHRHAESLEAIQLESKGLDVALGGGRFRSVVSGGYRHFDAQGVVSAAIPTSTPEPKTVQPADSAKTADFDRQIRVVRDDISDLKRRSADTDKQIAGIRGDVHSLLVKIGKGSTEPKTTSPATDTTATPSADTGKKTTAKKTTAKKAAAPAPATPTTAT